MIYLPHFQHPQLNELIERRFSHDGDVQTTLDYVHNSDGLEQTKFLAQKYCLEAVRFANTLRDSPHQKGLISITEKVNNTYPPFLLCPKMRGPTEC
jgi:decaprenyl-diphosphate synthase subunit 1